MHVPDPFGHITQIQGVDRFILLDRTGAVVAHNMDAPQKAARAVFISGRHMMALGKNRLKYVLFKRKNQKNMIVLPTGSGVLGVFTQETTAPLAIVHTLLYLIDRIAEGPLNAMKQS